MKLSTRQDIEAPVERVFAALSDFPSFERAALRRGAEVARLDAKTAPGAGMTWSVAFRWRGKARRILCTLQDYSPPEALHVRAEGTGIDATLVLGVLALSRGRCRLGVALDLRPRSLTARLMLQTARLGKARLMRRFEARIAEFALRIENENSRALGGR